MATHVTLDDAASQPREHRSDAPEARVLLENHEVESDPEPVAEEDSGPMELRVADFEGENRLAGHDAHGAWPADAVRFIHGIRLDSVDLCLFEGLR